MMPTILWLLVMVIAQFSCRSIGSSVPRNGNRVLIAYDSATKLDEDYSQFLDLVEQANFEVSKVMLSNDVELVDYGHDRIIDTDILILLLTKSRALPKKLTSIALEKFMKDGGNLFVATSGHFPNTILEFAAQLDILFPPKNYRLTDTAHALEFSNAFSSRNHNDKLSYAMISKHTRDLPIAYRGSSHTFESKANALLLPVLRAENTAYLHDQDANFLSQNEILLAGNKNVLVSAFQTIGSSRFVLSTSVDMFSNEFFSLKDTGNVPFTSDLLNWISGRSGLLKSGNIVHFDHTKDYIEMNPQVYRKGDWATISVPISMTSNGRYIPYEANDVQLEVIMLDPYIRTDMKLASKNDTAALYTAKVHLPNQHGVFKFRVQYYRPGLSQIDESTTVTLRHFHHDEFERFLPVAFPYYASHGAIVLVFVVFAFVWLFHDDKAIPKKKTS